MKQIFKGKWRDAVYKIVRGTLAASAAAITDMLTASPYSWIAIPILATIGKAVRGRLVSTGKEKWVKWVVI